MFMLQPYASQSKSKKDIQIFLCFSHCFEAHHPRSHPFDAAQHAYHLHLQNQMRNPPEFLLKKKKSKQGNSKCKPERQKQTLLTFNHAAKLKFLVLLLPPLEVELHAPPPPPPKF
ncbi:hypothetical protein Hanom_Chr14g01336951 [Helianthus anomalus]